MAATHPAVAIPSAREVAARIYQQHGIPGLYRGVSSTLWREAPGFGAYFWAVSLEPPHLRNQSILFGNLWFMFSV
jgi:hypothetical protein